MKSFGLAALVAVLCAGVATASDPKADAPRAGLPLMFKVGGEYKPVVLTSGHWTAPSAGVERTPWVQGGRYYPAGVYVFANRDGKDVNLRWQVAVKGGAAGWYAEDGQPAATAPKGTAVFVSAPVVTSALIVCDGTVCSLAQSTAPRVTEHVQSGLFVQRVCDGTNCYQEQGYAPAPAVVTEFVIPQTNCANGKCNTTPAIIWPSFSK